jgi:integrase
VPADRDAWEQACRPGSRFKPGGAGSHLAPVSQRDFANRYGAFLGFLQRTGRLESHPAGAATQVTVPNVEAYLADLTVRVRSVTVHNCIYKLRRAAELLSPESDFSWLAEIEKDLALIMEPKSKFDRLVFTQRLVEAGLALVVEAEEFAKGFAHARGVRNGLMIALLALGPIRIKNFAALEIGVTFKEIQGKWWITLPSIDTKTRRPDERCIPEWLNPAIHLYLSRSRPVLLGSTPPTNALWISSTTGRPMTTKNMGTLISKVTHETLGVDVSPHLFRTAAASTAATFGGRLPHLASALLNHTDPRVTDEHYIRSNSLRAGQIYSEIVSNYLRD